MRYLIISILTVLLDVATKYWSVLHLGNGEIIRLTGFANLRLAYNPGAAFSFLKDAGGWQIWLLSGISLIISLALLWVLVTSRYERRWTAVAFAFLLGGAVGNLIDRIRLGYVVDMIDLHAFGWHWPTFNIADSAIFIAAAMLILEAFGVFGPRPSDAGHGEHQDRGTLRD